MTNADKAVHLQNFIDRLYLEQYLQREFCLKLPFLVFFPMLFVLFELELPNSTIFEIHSNLRNSLHLDESESIGTIDEMYSYLQSSFFSSLVNFDPLDPHFLNFSDSSPPILSRTSEFYRSTVVLAWPVTYITRGKNVYSSCSSLKSKSFVRFYEKDYPIYYYCGLNPNTLPEGIVCNSSTMSRISSQLIACVDKTVVDTSMHATDSVSVIVNDDVYGSIQVSPEFYLTAQSVSELQTKNWLTIYTSSLVISGLFYTPSMDTYTIMHMRFTLDEVGGVTSKVRLRSFVDISNNTTWKFLSWICILVSTLQLVIDIWRLIILVRALRSTKQGKGMSSRDGGLGEPFFYVVCGMTLIVFLVLKTLIIDPSFIGFIPVPDKLAANFQSFSRSLLDISARDDPQDFMDTLHNLISIMNVTVNIRAFGFLVVFMQCLRFVFFLAVHPRVAMLVETVRIGSDDIVHFSIIFAIMLSLLSFLAKWIFGDAMKLFSNFGQAMFVQFQMLMGSWPFDDFSQFDNQFAMIVYILFFGIVMFFMIMNFFLAIVVDSFESCKQEIEDYKVEQSLLQDSITILTEMVKGSVGKWPPRYVMVDALQVIKESRTEAGTAGQSHLTVTYPMLCQALPEKYYSGASNMFDYYHSEFAESTEDFLHPIFGKHSSIRVQVTAAVSDIGSLVRSMAVELDILMTEMRAKRDANLVGQVSNLISKNENLLDERRILMASKSKLERQLKETQDELAKEKGLDDEAREALKRDDDDPIERKVKQMDKVLGLLEDQRNIFCRNPGSGLVINTAVSNYQNASQALSSSSSIGGNHSMSKSIPISVESILGPGRSKISSSSRLVEKEKIDESFTGLSASLDSQGFLSITSLIRSGTFDHFELVIFANRLLESHGLFTVEIDELSKFCEAVSETSDNFDEFLTELSSSSWVRKSV